MDIHHRLDAIEAIRRLKARYFRCIDFKQWEELREVFTPDADIAFPETMAEPIGIDAFVKVSAEYLDHAVSVHHGHMPEIDIVDDDHATGLWSMEDIIFFDGEGQKISGLQQMHGYGHYHERYRRIDGRWRIASMRLTRLRRQDHSRPIACA